MIPKRVTLENFLSFGEKQEIVFNNDEVLWVIGGPNGSGKSAVFDAMTYCLFGTHRASGTRIKDSDNKLIRHGENGFSILFEFEFNGIDYRISRVRQSAGRQPTPTVERRTVAGEWERIANVNTVKELDTWVVNTLGLNSEQFQASVLLRQGKADAFVDAKPATRFEILKGIINMEQYEELAERVSAKLSVASRDHKDVKTQLDSKVEVTPDQLAQAAELEQRAKEEKARCDEALSLAGNHKKDAALWNKLQKEKSEITPKIEAAKLLHDKAEKIEQDHRRWLLLKDALPKLKTLLDLREKLKLKEPQLQQLTQRKVDAEQQALEQTEALAQLAQELQHCREQKGQADLQTQPLTSAITALKARLKASTELAELRHQLEAFPASLEQDLLNAKEVHGQAVYAQDNARVEVARIKALLDHAESHRNKITKVQIGVNCSACGQPVTAEHAQKEKQLAEDAVKEQKSEHAAASNLLTNSNSEVTRLAQELTALQEQERKKSKLLHQLEISRNNYQSLGELKPAAELQASLDAQESQWRSHHHNLQTLAQSLMDLEPQHKRLQESLNSLVREKDKHVVDLQKLNQEIAGLQGQLAASQEHVPAEWKSASAAEHQTLVAELNALISDNIESRHHQLSQSRNQFAVLQSQLDNIENQLASIPEAARITVQEAEQAEVKASTQRQQSEKDYQAAFKRQHELDRQANEYEAIAQKLAQCERQKDLMALLDQKLGKKGLQLALMSDAQTQIVDLARQTLLQLSDHQLSLELNQPDGDDSDQALDLCVRNAENAHATPMEYLSGSQKFRVAIAIALAIGRYSAGQSRPLESVIIDEGFGSLDREGLNSMAEELKELQRSQLLRRIILVSHQQEFVDRFPAGYRLIPGEKGTVAELRKG